MKPICYIILSLSFALLDCLASSMFVRSVAPNWKLKQASYATNDVRIILSAGSRLLVIDLNLCASNQAAKSRFDELRAEVNAEENEFLDLGERSAKLFDKGNHAALLFTRSKFVCRIQGEENAKGLKRIAGRIDNFLKANASLVEYDLKLHVPYGERNRQPIPDAAPDPKKYSLNLFPDYIRKVASGVSLRSIYMPLRDVVEIYCRDDDHSSLRVYIRFCASPEAASKQYVKTRSTAVQTVYHPYPVGDEGCYVTRTVGENDPNVAVPLRLTSCHWVRGRVCVSIVGVIGEEAILEKAVEFDEAMSKRGIEQVYADFTEGFDSLKPSPVVGKSSPGR